MKLKDLLRSDIKRLGDEASMIRELITNAGLKYIIVWRLCKHLQSYRIYKFSLYPILRIILHRWSIIYGISIPLCVEIGKGFYIGHHGGIVINPKVVIGNNCNISHGVTIGEKFGGNRPGVPIIGDNVYIGPGAKIIGGVNIGSHSCIGANSVITKDIPEYAVVAGIPARIISYRGSSDYIPLSRIAY